MTGSGLLLATAEAAAGGPSALVPAGGSTLLTRLVGQLEALGVAPVWVLTRPEWAPAVRERVGDRVRVLPSADLAEDLRHAADIAGRVRGRLLVGYGDVLLHREALAGLLADPRIATGVLVSSSALRSRGFFRIRSARGRVVAAASPYHRASAPTGAFLGFMKVAAADCPALAAAARELAALAEAGARPSAWDDELDRKAADWRLQAWRRAVERETGELPRLEDAPAAGAVELDAEAEEDVATRVRAASRDAVALLLTALVRSGVHVGQSHLRGFFLARALSAGAVARAESEMDTIDEDRVALASAVKSSDGFFTTFFVSPYSRYIARFAARRGWTPNAMTTVSMAIGVAAAAAFAAGSRAGLVAGAVLLQAAFTIDCVDGQLARYTRTFSKLGAWLDSVFDRGKEYLVYAGLAVGAWRGFHDHVWTLAAAALTLQTVRHMVDFSFAATRHEAIAAAPRVPLRQVEDRAPGAGLPADPAGAEPEASAGGAAPAPPERTPSPGGTAVATAAAPVTVATAPAPSGGLPRRALSMVGRLDRRPGVVWLKRIIVLPIGERFALISATAAFGTPRLTFTVLLAWGSLAALYAVPGRVLRSLVR